MKKSLILLIFFIPFFLFSQEAVKKNKNNLKFGVRAGISGSQISGDDMSGFHKLGAYAGVYTTYPISKSDTWKVAFELNFLMKGSSTFNSGVDEINATNYYKLSMYYIEIPVFFRYRFKKILKGIGLEIGPSLNFLPFYTEAGYEGSIKKMRRPVSFFELAGTVGIDYFFKDHWGGNIRYSNSLAPVRIPNWAVNRGIHVQFNSTITFSAFYQF